MIYDSHALFDRLEIDFSLQNLIVMKIKESIK